MRKARTYITAAMCVLVLALGARATLAYLTDSESVTNTFTVGNVGIDLYEHDYVPETNELDMAKEVEANDDYKLVPATVLPKDPTIEVDEGSEDCWLFVKVENPNSMALSKVDYILWSIDDAVWTPLAGEANVWYAKYTAGGNATFNVLKGKQVEINPALIKSDMDAIDGVAADDEAEALETSLRPSLKFTAYAVQYAGFDTAATAAENAAAAWAQLNA